MRLPEQVDVLEISTLEALRELRWTQVEREPLSAFAITHILKLCSAMWLHSGDPTDPHAALTSELCSDGFVDVLRAIRYTNVCEIMARRLAWKIRGHVEATEFEREIDWVIGSDHAAADLSHSVATCFGAMHDFPEKGVGTAQFWKRF